MNDTLETEAPSLSTDKAVQLVDRAASVVDKLWLEGLGGTLATPTIRAHALEPLTGCEVWVKLENLQATGSFKERGAFATLARLSEDERARGVVAASAGNHAQGVARHGTALGITTTIFMPNSTPMIKVNATRNLGAEVKLAGDTFEETSQAARDFAESNGCFFAHPFDDPYVIAGQGTIANEMLVAVPDLDALIVPIGGGGLAAGMAHAARRLNRDIELYGVQADLFPSTYNAYHHRSTEVGGVTLAEGIAVKTPGKVTLPILKAYLDDVFTVKEREIERALNLYLTQLRVLTEGAGAAGLAALLANKDKFKGRKVGLIISGGNIDTRLLSSLLLRDLARTNRLARFRIELLDVPGQLSDVSAVISNAGGNVTDVSYHKTFSDLPAKVTYIDISLEAQDADHMNNIYTALMEAGFKVEYADY